MSTQYNLAALRRLLLSALTAEELPRFCRDRPPFQPVCDRLGVGQGLDDMVDELLEYARTHRLLDELLAAIQAYNPGQYALFAPHLEAAAGERALVPGAGTGIPLRGWVLLALLAVDLGLLLLSGWCLFGHDPALVAYVQTALAVVGLLVAILAIVLAFDRSAAWQDVLRLLGTERRWTYVVALVTAACLAAAALFCLGRQPPARPPTAYMALVVDNGPVPAGHDFTELRAAVQVELAHALPNAALSVRVFGIICGRTRRLLDFYTGNAADAAAALGSVQVVALSDLTEAVRQALDDLLAQQGSQPRMLVVVTWGSDGCGGDLDAALARYRQQLGSTVSVSLISLGTPPAVTMRPGVSVLEVDDVQQARAALRFINRVLETGNWAPRTPVFQVTPAATP